MEPKIARPTIQKSVEEGPLVKDHDYGKTGADTYSER